MPPDDSPPVERLLELAASYQRSRTLFTLLALDVPSRLAAGALDGDALARALGLHPLAADRFLRACVALGLLTHEGDRYANTPTATRYLTRASADYLGDYLGRHVATDYALWTDLTDRLRAWRPARTDHADPADDDQGVEAMEAQHALARLVGRSLADAYDFSRHRALLDLGGGTGAMAISACERHPHLRALVVDRGPVVAAAARRAREAGLSARVATLAADFKRDPLPGGFDVALLANLLSVSSEATNRALLARIHEALPPGGAVILSGWILDDGRTSPTLPVLFCLQDILWDAPDVERSASRYAAWLADAGFVDLRRARYCPPTSFLAGRKP